MLALLITLGLGVGVVQASELPASVGIALVDEVEDTADAGVIATELVAVEHPSTFAERGATSPPPFREHEHFVFRPPRVPAFN
jgi:hypothetical protein